MKRWRQGIKQISLLFFFTIFFALPLFPGNEYNIQGLMDWKKQVFFIDIRTKSGSGYLPDSRFRVEEEIRDKFHTIFYDTVSDIPVDSYTFLRDILHSDPSFAATLNLVSEKSKMVYSYTDRVKRLVNVRYSCDLFGENGLVPGLVKHKYVKPLPLKLGFIPSKKYSGLVIYVKGEYKLYGKKESGRLQPVFFPEFFDEEMNLVFSKNMCDPGAIIKWGMAAYTDSLDDAPYLNRIGTFPLKTIAVKLFGKNNSDIILSNNTVNKLLSLEENRNLLRQGRVLIILDSLE